MWWIGLSLGLLTCSCWIGWIGLLQSLWPWAIQLPEAWSPWICPFQQDTTIAAIGYWASKQKGSLDFLTVLAVLVLPAFSVSKHTAEKERRTHCIKLREQYNYLEGVCRMLLKQSRRVGWWFESNWLVAQCKSMPEHAMHVPHIAGHLSAQENLCHPLPLSCWHAVCLSFPLHRLIFYSHHWWGPTMKDPTHNIEIFDQITCLVYFKVSCFLWAEVSGVAFCATILSCRPLFGAAHGSVFALQKIMRKLKPPKIA